MLHGYNGVGGSGQPPAHEANPPDGSRSGPRAPGPANSAVRSPGWTVSEGRSKPCRAHGFRLMVGWQGVTDLVHGHNQREPVGIGSGLPPNRGGVKTVLLSTDRMARRADGAPSYFRKAARQEGISEGVARCHRNARSRMAALPLSTSGVRGKSGKSGLGPGRAGSGGHAAVDRNDRSVDVGARAAGEKHRDAAMSSSRPMRFMGTAAAIASPNASRVAAIIFEGNGPGATAFTVMCCGPSSFARTRGQLDGGLLCCWSRSRCASD